MTSRFAVAKEKMLGDIVGVIGDVFGSFASPKRRTRRRWVLVNPYSGSRSAKLSVYLTGPRAGGWIDFTNDDCRGDLVDLVAFGREGTVNPDSRMRAVEWAEDRYGIRRMAPEAKDAAAAAAAARRALQDEAEARSQAEQRERVRKTFFAADAKILGTPVETYFRSRGAPLDLVPHLAPAFRFRPDCEYWPLAPLAPDGRRLGKGPEFPALVSAMVSADGRLNALHLTFLALDGSSKAPVRRIARRRGLDPDDFSEKLFKGDVEGFVIRVTHGPSGLSAERAAEAGISGPCGITEGIEDAVTAGIAEPRLRMWAAGSLSGLLHVPDHPCVSSWLIFQDNDWHRPQAQRLFRRAVARLRAFGKPVEVTAMPADWGKDVNDAIRQED